MARVEKPSCIVLERMAEVLRENAALRSKIKILTESIVSGNEGYLETLRKQESGKLDGILQGKK